jgi:hypothetical protein
MTVPLLTLMLLLSIAAFGADVGWLGGCLWSTGKGAIVRRMPDAALLKHSGATAEFFGSLTWSFVTDEATRRRVRSGGLSTSDRVGPETCQRPASCGKVLEQSPVAYPTKQMVTAGGGRRRLPRRRPAVQDGWYACNGRVAT